VKWWPQVQAVAITTHVYEIVQLPSLSLPYPYWNHFETTIQPCSHPCYRTRTILMFCAAVYAYRGGSFLYVGCLKKMQNASEVISDKMTFRWIYITSFGLFAFSMAGCRPKFLNVLNFKLQTCVDVKVTHKVIEFILLIAFIFPLSGFICDKKFFQVLYCPHR
jgi:hypothetical protein